jgi:hypothetical protein
MNDIPSYLKRAAERIGFDRVRYNEEKTPSLPEDICVMVFFGDVRSSFILSSILLKKYREQIKGSKYFILCSWPGQECFFPYVDEYWAIKNEDILGNLQKGALGFYNTSESELFIIRKLNWFFKDVVDFSVLNDYYNNGITQKFWDRFQNITRTLPSVPSVGIMGSQFMHQLEEKKGEKVVLYPSKFIQHWKYGESSLLKSSREFWLSLSKKMLDNNIIPVIFQDFRTYDLSNTLTDECIYVDEKETYKLLGIMRHVGCVLDVFSGISRLAIAARTPFLACDERSRYMGLKEYEIDDLCCDDILPREYIFTFSTIIERGSDRLWEVNIFNNIIIKLKNLLKDINRNALPPTSEQTMIVPYEVVRRRKMLRLGAKFIKITRD